jgi:predicted nucleic acid-binding protein
LIDLLDVNVWVAPAVESHGHHAGAEQYWRSEADQKVAFTTVTCLGLTRIVSNAKIAEGRPLTVPEAWTLYMRWREQPTVTFLHEPPSCHLVPNCIINR